MSKLIARAKTTTNPKLYLDFFKRYYKEKTKALVICTTLIGICAVAAGLVMAATNLGNVFIRCVLVAAGAVLAIYPRYSYRRPYKSVKDNKITTKFEFYDDKLVEIGTSSKEEYPYSELSSAWETEDYFYIYHTKETASVVDKSGIKGMTPQELSDFLKTKLQLTVKR